MKNPLTKIGRKGKSWLGKDNYHFGSDSSLAITLNGIHLRGSMTTYDEKGQLHQLSENCNLRIIGNEEEIILFYNKLGKQLKEHLEYSMKTNWGKDMVYREFQLIKQNGEGK